jgi:hypothetical protein
MIKTTTNPTRAREQSRGAPKPQHLIFLPLDARILPGTCVEARLSQRVAMDDLASYFVEERSKVR